MTKEAASDERLHRLLREFVKLGHSMLGYGPRHPVVPNPDLQAEIDKFLAENPFLKRDQGYVDFLETYSSALVDWPNKEFFLFIYGFNPGVNIYLPNPDESLVEQGSFFRFAEVSMKTQMGESVSLSFAWSLTGNRRSGVYRWMRISSEKGQKTLPYTWYCETFLDWLEDLVIKKGKLLD